MNLIKKDTEKIPRETVSDKHETRHCIMLMQKGFLSDGLNTKKQKQDRKDKTFFSVRTSREVCKQGDFQINDEKV